jgi:Ni/Fe-hydrogenase subunit HybB-like protein
MSFARRRLLLLRGATLGALALLVAGLVAYLTQLRHGLGVTGLSRRIPWGLYISQFTFLVGIGASAVTVLLPYYVHRQRVFAKALVLGELVAVIALTMALSCILVDLGQPGRLLNILLYPSPSSLMFWDCLTLTGYLTLSAIGLGAVVFARGRSPGAWVRILALATIPLAIGIHVVTALLYAGLAARPAWMTAVLAPRFLATAFASGPALLILLASALARTKSFDVGREAVARLTTIMTYAALASLLMMALELFTALYSGIPQAGEHWVHLFTGVGGHSGLAPIVYASLAAMVLALVVLLVPGLRRRPRLALVATGAILLSVLLEKGLVLVTSGFVPSPLGYVQDYRPSAVELTIVAGIYAGGALAFLVAAPWLLAPLESPLATTSSSDHAPPTATACTPGMAGSSPMET